MSVIPSEFAQCPFPSSSPNLIYALATQQDWWSYRQLRALHPNLSHDQLYHRPFYRPATHLSFTEPTPIQVGSEHYFEWLHKESRIPIVAFHLIIHPTFTFAEPLFTFGSQHLKPFPIIHCLWSDCPRHINLLTSDFLDQTLVHKWPDQNVDAFHLLLQDFFSCYYRPVTPFSFRQDLYPNSPTPPLYSFQFIPHSSTSSEAK